MTEINSKSNFNNRNYLSFWTGQQISLFGSELASFALIWWLALNSGSAFVFGIATFAKFAPEALTLLVSGVYIDRWSRKGILIVADTIQAALSVVILLVFMTGTESIFVLILILALRGILQAFHAPTLQAVVPTIAPPERLPRINALTHLADGFISIIAPPLSALLILFYGITSIFLLDLLTYFGAIPFILWTRIPRNSSRPITKNRFLRDFIEGFSFIVSTKGLLAILVIATTYNTLLGPIYHTLIPVFVTDYNNGNSTHLALVFSSFQLGVLITSIVLTTKDIIKNKPLGMLAGSLMSCIGLIALVFSPTGDWLISSAVAMFVAGCSFSVVVICSQTIWQHAVPMEKLGRVLSARIFLARSLMPIGSLLVGAIAEVIGIVPVFGILPTIAILAVLGIYSLGNVGEIRVQKQPAL